MSLFQTTAPQATRAKEPPVRRVDNSALTIIAPGTTVTGDIESQGVIKVEGRVHGSVRSAGQILVAKGGAVEGDLLTREAIVGGEIRGTIRAAERVEIQGTAQVYGDVLTQRLLVSEGGEVNGAVVMGSNLESKPAVAAIEPPSGIDRGA